MVIFLLTAGLAVLVVVCGYLYAENQAFRRTNRELIIQNDSVMSANIELKTMSNNLMLQSGKKLPF